MMIDRINKITKKLSSAEKADFPALIEHILLEISASSHSDSALFSQISADATLFSIASPDSTALSTSLDRYHAAAIEDARRRFTELSIEETAAVCGYRSLSLKGTLFDYRHLFLETPSQPIGILTLAATGPAADFEIDSPEFGILLNLFVIAMIRMERSAILSGLTTASAASSGRTALEDIAHNASEALGADIVLIGETRPECEAVDVRAIVDRRGPRHITSYPLAGSPCGTIVPDQCLIVANDVAHHYPHDAMLAEDGIKGYAGLGLQDADGRSIGLLVALFRDRIILRHRIEKVIRTFAQRAGSEILRERTERSHADMQQRLKQIVDEIPDGLVVLDGHGRIAFCNPAGSEIFETSSAELVGARICERLGVSADALPTSGSAADHKSGNVPDPRPVGAKASDLVGRILFAPNLGKWLSLRGYANQDNRTLFLRDISEYAEREKRYQELSTLNRRFLECSPDIITTIDRQRRLVFVSDRCRDVLGYEPSEMIGRHTWEFIHSEDQELTARHAADNRTHEGTGTVENRYLRKDGTAVPILWASVWSDEDDMGFAVGRDMSPWRQMELRVREAQRVEALGRLTGGISHDFNNLLAVVMGNAEMLADALEGQESMARMANLILSAAARGRDLNERLLTFARQKALTPAVVDLAELLERFEPLIQQAIGPRIRLALRFAPDLPAVTVDVTQLEAAVLNLAINARDAMPRGGVLGIRASRTDIYQEEQIDSGILAPGPYVRLSVSDSGTGMTDDVRRRAFDPFFSTKDASKGSGLGLSTIHGFMNQSGGGISIDTAPDIGTVVHLHFPAPQIQDASGRSRPGAPDEKTDRNAVSQTDAPLPSSMPVAAGSAEQTCILVVEDDPMVWEYVTGLLEGRGYDVVAAETATQALTILERRIAGAHDPGNGHPVDLVLSDIVLPDGMDGIALARRLRDLYPGIPILLTTGYYQNAGAQTSDGLAEAGLGDVEIIRKPYRPGDLTSKIAEVMKQQLS